MPSNFVSENLKKKEGFLINISDNVIGITHGQSTGAEKQSKILIDEKHCLLHLSKDEIL